jgi:hypothetical protein
MNDLIDENASKRGIGETGELIAILAIYLTPPTPTPSVLGCGRGLSQDVA